MIYWFQKISSLLRPVAPAAALIAALCVAVPSAIADKAGAVKSEPSSVTTLEDVKKEWSDATAAIRSYTLHQRDEALADSKALLASMDAQIDALEARADARWDGLTAEIRENRRSALKALRRQRADLSEWYGGMKHGSSEAWDEVKDGFVGAYDELSDAFSDASKEFN